MKQAFAAGVVSIAVGLAGYVVGIYVAYPGRAFSITVTMVGITLLVVGMDQESETT